MNSDLITEILNLSEYQLNYFLSALREAELAPVEGQQELRHVSQQGYAQQPEAPDQVAATGSQLTMKPD